MAARLGSSPGLRLGQEPSSQPPSGLMPSVPEVGTPRSRPEERGGAPAQASRRRASASLANLAAFFRIWITNSTNSTLRQIPCSIIIATSTLNKCIIILPAPTATKG
jgi:hypothetical protein